VLGWASSKNLGVGELDACGGEVELPFHPTIWFVLAIDNPPRENAAMVHHKKPESERRKPGRGIADSRSATANCADICWLKLTGQFTLCSLVLATR
jgi:hypothetical protein